MIDIQTYPKMNEEIKNILALSLDDPFRSYVLKRIEELEQQNEEYKRMLKQAEVEVD